jgi:hypothetical protein
LCGRLLTGVAAGTAQSHISVLLVLLISIHWTRTAQWIKWWQWIRTSTGSNYSFYHQIQSTSCVHQASCPVDIGNFSSDGEVDGEPTASNWIDCEAVNWIYGVFLPSCSGAWAQAQFYKFPLYGRRNVRVSVATILVTFKLKEEIAIQNLYLCLWHTHTHSHVSKMQL